MRWVNMRTGLVVLAALAASACNQVSLEPPEADSAPVAVPQALNVDIRPLAGRTYADASAVPEMDRYAIASLRLTEVEQARFEAGMAVQEPAILASGGGAEALVFSGCAASGCPHGRSVLAIDARNGAVFVGVAGQGGSEQLVPNDRLEALLRVTSPSMRWDDPVRAPQVAALPENTP